MTLGPGEPITVPSHWRATHDAGAGWSRASAKKERKNERKKDAQSSRYPGIDRTVLVGLSLVVAIVVFANSWGKFVSDTQPELYFTPGRVFWESLHAWVPSVGQVGIPNLNTGLAPEAALIWLIRVVGTPAWVTVRIWRLALYLVAGLGIRRWYRELEGGKADTAALLAVTVFYVANPYVITVGATTPIMLPYAVLPWLLRAHLRSVHDPTSWRRAVVFGLTFAAMSGQNAGIVPLFLLLALPCQILWVRWTDGVPWRSLWASLWRCGAVTTGLSLYWLLPSLAALRTGQAIVSATESPVAVAQTTSWSEVSRLLGNWPLYGRVGPRVYEPSHVYYLINPILVVATTLAPAAAAALASFGRHRARLLAGILLAVGLPVVVGQYPPDGSIPAARIVRWIFTNVPGTVGFRTTVKAGGLIVLGDVVCIGIGVAAARLRWRDWTLPAKLALVVAGCLVELVSIAPALSGHLWNQTWNIPSYWQQAASVVNRGPSTSRVLVVPGSNGGDYQWGPRSPDDILPSVLSRPYASRSTVSFAGDPAGNLMAGTDVAMNENTLPAGAVSVLARYLGASQVLVRNDQRYWELVGAPPHVIESEILADRGLAGRIDYGFAGQNTQPPSSGTSDIPPLQLFNVTSPTTIERAQPAGHLVLVDGDGFSLPSLASLGILDGSQPFEWMGSVTTASLEQAAADGATIVITDTNRRRSWGENKTNESFGPTLSANQAIDASQGQSLTLFQTRTATQTVTSLAGAASITGTGPLFTLQPYGGPFQAFDGDPNTAWLTGGFGETGMTLTIDFSAPRQISRFTITAAHSSPVSASTVLVTVGSRKIRVDLRPFPDATPISLPTTTSSSLSIQITGLAGHGTNQVGIAEVSIPGLRVRQLVELPTTFDQLFNSVDSTTQARLATAPLDVVMVRARSGTGVFSANEEANLDREFVLPQARNFSVTGVLDSIADLPTQTIDLLETARPGQPAPCFTVGFLDDTLLRVSLGEPVSQAITSGARVPLVGCDGAPIPLGPGAHFLETFPTIVLDQVVFMSAGSTPAAAAAPSVTVDSESPTAVSLTVGASSSPYYLVGGQAFNAGWQGTIDGRSLGPPVLIDGYTFGWRIPASGSHDILLSYGPQFTTTAAFLLSILALLGCGLILAWPFVRRRRRGAHSREAAPEAAKGARHTAEAVTSPPNGDTPGHDTAGHDTPGRDPAGRDPAGRDSPGTDTPKPTPVSAASRLRLFLVSRALPWLALAAALSVLDSYVGLGVAVLLGLALRFGASSRLLLRAGAVVLLGVPVALVIHHIPTLATVSPNFVMGNTIASHIAFAGLALAVTGLCLPDRDRPEPAHARGTRRASS